MAVIIDLNDRIVLKLSNSLFGRLHRACFEMITEKTNVNIKKLLDQIDQEVYGAGAVYADIADYLKKKEEVYEFAEMIAKATVTEKETFKAYEQGLETLNNFHQELLNYAKELE